MTAVSPLDRVALAVALSLGVIWVLGACTEPIADHVLSVEAEPPPDSIVEEVDGATAAIVVGTVVSTIGEGSEPGAPDAGYDFTPEPSEEVPGFDIDYTDFEVMVDEIVLGHGDLEEHSTFTLRLQGWDSLAVAYEVLGWPMAERQYLLFLDYDLIGDDGSYGTSGGYLDRMLVDGEEVEYAPGSPVPYAEGMSPSEFIEAVREAAG